MTNAIPTEIANIGIAINMKKNPQTIPYMASPPKF